MAHYVKVVDGTVVNGIVAEPEFFDTFVDSSPGQWIQTSYNTKGGIHYNPETGEPSEDQTKALRKNYAGLGYTYDATRDAFIPPQPYPSWILNRESCLWDAPVPMPEGELPYRWDESTMDWVEVPLPEGAQP